MIKGRSYAPAVMIATALAVGMGAILLAQIVVHTELYFLNKWLLGLDYKDFYDASRHILAGQDPYTLRRYVTPPIPALLNIPLVSFPFEQARLVVMLLALLFVLLSYYLMQRRFDLQRKPDGPLIFVAGVVIIVLSYPVYFLFDRANIDGFVLLLMCAGLFFVDRHNLLAGLSLRWPCRPRSIRCCS